MAVLSRIGPYVVLRPLGAGGMAETFVAERRGPGEFVQRVCLKRIRTDLAKDPELVRQFMAEAAIAARLRHATIASVLDFGEDQGVLYMAIELIDGVDLRELIQSAPGGLPAELVVYVAVELCTALDIAHSAQGGAVVHRDVSPSNVLISRQGEVKLADFGIARTETGPAHTRTGIVRGKVPYMAPEYARTGRFDARADLFSLGVLLHECAYGVRPFDGATDLETLERATRGERLAVPARAALPEDLVDIIGQLLDAEPERRFRSARPVLEALLSLPSDPRARRELGKQVSALRPAQPEPTRDPPSPSAAEPLAATRTLESELVVPKRKLGRVLALVAAASALAVLTVAWLRSTPETHQPPAAAEARTNAPAPEPATGATAPAPVPPPSDPVRRPIAAPAPADSSAPSAETKDKLAHLEVVVMPWGVVFVNDGPAIQSPARLNLKAGTYTIRGKGSNGNARQRVQLNAGDRRVVKLELQ